MKNLLLTLLVVILILPSCEKDKNEEFVFTIMCGAELAYGIDNGSKRTVSCMFIFFEPGDYVSVEKIISSSISDFGRGVAIKSNGEKINSIGYAYYSGGGGYADANYHDWDKLGYNHRDIREGTFYVACFPTVGLGKTFPYKAKEFTKIKNKGLFINPVFTSNSYYGVDGYKYFEWDE